VPIGDGAGPMFWPVAGCPGVASVAYVGPGAFAGKIGGGAQYGYPLLWVVRGPDLMMVVQ
jgi:Mn2+/Fe2+ NRAMP family transporter